MTRRALVTAWVFQGLVALALMVLGAHASAQTVKRDFDHVQTGFPLTGLHVNARCESCHVNGVFKGTPKDCASCHTSGARLARNNVVKPAKHIATQESCDTCHNTKAFSGAKFSHAGVVAGSCATCHNGGTAPGKPSNHIATQASCDSCHRTSAWRPATGFDHAGVVQGTCATCHNGVRATGKPPKHIPVANSVSCDSCHRSFSAWQPTTWNHTQVAVANQCSTCHSGSHPPADAKPANHTRYEGLVGVAIANCDTCHKAGFTAWSPAKLHASISLSNQCATCHAKPAVHVPAENECQNCHKTSGWAGAKIDHSAFTAATNCEKCHNGVVARGKSPTHLPTTANCIGCHRTNAWTPAGVDHSGFTAATNCASCHNGSTATGKPGAHIPTTANCLSCHATNGWKPTKFNHSQVVAVRQCSTCHSGSHPPADAKPASHTPYERLSGVAIANCDTCHKAGYAAWTPARLHASVSLTNQCATCHAKPAVHPVSVSTCESCHNTSGWAGARVNHSGFTTATNCASCHNGSTATGKPATHLPTTANCISCHSTSAWTPARVDHSGFTAATNCASCHNGSTATGKSATHVPVGATNCFNCHSVTGWRPTKFNHSQVTVASQCASCHSGSFSPADGRPANHIPYQALSGAAIANCDTCHRSGFAAWTPARFHGNVSVSTQCASCHTGNFPPAVGRPNTPIHANATTCESCHNTSGWAGARVNHSGFTAATNCASCHNGTAATGRPANHIPVGASNCVSCHTVSAWRPTRFNHTQVVVTAQCSTCHSGAFPPADGRPTNHIPYQTLSGVAIANCDTCHRSGFAAWTPARFHGNVSVSTQCASCHTGNFPPAVARPNTPVHVGVTNCESCHRSTASWLTVVFAHSAANAVGTGTCDTCHNGSTARGKPATHIPIPAGAARCDSCHRSQSSFATAVTMNHAVVSTATCKSCHSGGYTAAGALAKPANHIPETQLLNGAAMDCRACHTSTTSWGTLRMNHNASQGGGSGWCKACHATGTNFLGDMEKKALTHRTKTPAAIDCSESGCHRPLGTRGSTYSNWD